MKTTRTRFHIAVLAIALVALVIPAVSPAFTARADGKVLRYSINEPNTIDPQQASYVNQVAQVQALWRGLLRYDEQGNPVPSLATEAPTLANGGISKDGLTYTFKLGDFKWSDGKGSVTAEDFVYSWQRLVDPAIGSPYGGFLNDIVVNATEIQAGKAKATELGVKAVDDKTFQVSLVKPVSYLNAIAALWATYVVRKDNVERVSGDANGATGAWTDPANGPVVGAGPFILSKWDHGKEMIFDKNPNFGGTAAKLDQIVFPLTDDSAVSYAGFQAGELDVSFFPAAELEAIKADPNLSKQLLIYPGTCVAYLGMNNLEKPFNDPLVRQAFSLAINRELYSKVVAQGLSTPYYSFVPPGIPGNDPEAGKQYTYNPAKAKELLAKAGYPDGKDFPKANFNYTAGATGQRRADWLQAQLKEILGVDISMNPMDGAVFQAATSDAQNKLSGLTYSGWCADYLHASDYLSLVFGSGGENGNGLNHSGYKSAAFDAAAKAADNEGDPAKQAKLYTDAQNILLDDAPVTFMNIGLNVNLVNSRVKNLKYLPLDSAEPGSFFWEDVDVE